MNLSTEILVISKVLRNFADNPAHQVCTLPCAPGVVL